MDGCTRGPLLKPISKGSGPIPFVDGRPFSLSRVQPPQAMEASHAEFFPLSREKEAQPEGRLPGGDSRYSP